MSNLLPNEPRLLESGTQQQLTEHHLLPVLPAIGTLLRQIRSRLNPALSRAQPIKHGKPYPLGQCLEISLAVQRELQRLLAGQQGECLGSALASLVAFMGQGGEMRQVWGDLRGLYFQNAFLIGSLYVDVANDTVDPDKPPVEILPLEESGLVPVKDYSHFTRIARSYWQAEIYPNHLFPTLAPCFPLISLMPGSHPRLQVGNDYMIGLTIRDRFEPSMVALQQGRVPPDLVHWIGAAMARTPLAATFHHDRGQALSQCLNCRQRGLQAERTWRDDLVRLYLAVNAQLAKTFAVKLAKSPKPPLNGGRGLG